MRVSIAVVRLDRVIKLVESDNNSTCEYNGKYDIISKSESKSTGKSTSQSQSRSGSKRVAA